MSRGDFPSAKQDQFALRLPDGMRDRIAAEAAKNGRSMNSEIIHRLSPFFGLELTDPAQPKRERASAAPTLAAPSGELERLARILELMAEDVGCIRNHLVKEA